MNLAKENHRPTRARGQQALAVRGRLRFEPGSATALTVSPVAPRGSGQEEVA